MSSTRPPVRQRRHPLQPARWQRTLLSSAVLAATVAGAASPGLVQAQVKSAWFASGNMSNPGVATRQRALPMPAHHGPGAQAQVAQSRERLQHSLQNVGRTAAAIAAQQAAQNAARMAALQAPSAVPDGLGVGGLEAATGAQARWDGAAAARQSTQNGRQRVDIDQTSSRAVLHWNSFNVGRNTDLHFNQQSGDAVLNRVVGAQTAPSQILGRVQADGTVLVINQNGVVFGGASQVNVRNLVASAVNIKDEQFAKGLYGDVVDGQTEPTFANALKRINGKVVFDPATAGVTVEPGAQIRTHESESVTSGGGYVLLLGREVRNDGVVQTPGGQTVMAAGDAFVIRKGLASGGDRTSTTRGQQVSTLATADSRAGRVVNTGLIQAREGDVTLAGRELSQQGVLLSSTSVNTRGTVHLKAGGADATLELAPGSVTAIALESGGETALDVQRKNRLQESGVGNDLGFRDRRDQSLVAILSDSTIAFQDQSLVMATGGQIYVRAQKETQVQNGARLDVSGAVGVQLAMAANAVEINVQGNEQRDAPLNRDSRQLNNSNLWVDRRSLVYVPAGTQGYDSDRWYTAGGLLEVSGYLGTQGHTIGEWMASGGTVMVEGGRLTTHAGSQINVSGGTYDVQSGWMPLSWLRGADGRLYEASRAPGDLLYDGVYDGYVREHVRWGVNNRYRNPLIGPQRRFEQGYTVGRDAGRLQLAVQELDLAGEVLTTVYQGPRQIHAAQTPDPYTQGHMMLARRGQLVVGRPQPTFHAASQYLVDTPFAVAGSLVVGEDEKADLQLSADWINSQEWGRVSLAAKDRLDVQQALRVDAGGQIELYAQAVEVGADLTAPGGSIALGNVMQRYNNGSNIWEQLSLSNDFGAGPEEVRVRGGARLDVNGVVLPQARDNRAPAYVDGGRILLETSGDIILEAGSALDASSGYWSNALEQLQGGKGGSVSLLAGQVLRTGLLTVDGDIRAFGWTGSGTLTAKSSGYLIVGEGGPEWGTEGWKDYGMSETLAEDYVIQPGERSPFPFQGDQTWLLSGVVLDVAMMPNVSRDLVVVTQAPWVLPRGVNVQGVQPNSAWMGNRGQTVPAGTPVRFISQLAAGLVLPANVFPDGIPIRPIPREFKAGDIVTQELTLARGTYVPPGLKLARAPVLMGASRLASSLLQSGFSRYVLNGGAGLVVPGQTKLALAMPAYMERDGRVSLELPQLYTVNNRTRTITQRSGASLSLQAGNTQFSAHLLVAPKASLSVDPGQSITLAGNDQITLLGELRAPGGTVSIVPGERIPGTLQIDAQGDAARTGRSIWLGEQSVIDVSGQAIQSMDRLGQRFGKVMGGGTAQVGAYFKLGATEVNAFDGFVIMRPGAQIRADGANLELDLPRSGAQTVYGRAGTIAFSANNGLVLDGSLHAGLPGVVGMGGLLAINLETPIYGRVDRATSKGLDVPDEVRVPRELLLTQEHAPHRLANDLKPGQYDESLGYAQARFGVDLVQRGGFDGLSLMVNGLLSTDGRINADLGRELWLTATALGLREQAESSQVRLSAPYIRLAGTTRRGVEGGLMPSVMWGGGNYGNGGGPRGVPKTQKDSSLTLEAGHMDVQGSFMFGAMGDIIQNKPEPLRVDRLGYEQINLWSQGDLRFGVGETKVYTPGSVELAARQIYPASHAQAELTVGMASLVDPQWGNVRQYVRKDSTLSLRSTGPAPEALPYSVFGSLTLKASTVEQGGVLRAPLGNLTIGVNDYLGDSSLLHFLPGSVTSVSAHGLVMPYGGTADGLNYLYAGSPVEFRGQGSNPSIRLNGQMVQADEGSEFDLRGGGELLGAAFLTGRGGSVDARLVPMIRYDAKSGRFSLPDPSGNKVYAIVPANGGAYAPLVGENGAGAPELGANITIPAGVPGLPAGTYTLMPSSFALLPGAFRVEVHANRSLPGAPGPQQMRNGSWASSAVLGQAQVAQAGGLPVAVTVTDGEVLRRHAQYNETSYAQFAARQAHTYGIPLPVLERDGGRLVLQAARMDAERAALGETALRFDGKARFDGAGQGFGGILELESGRNFEILGNDAAATPGFAGVSLRAEQLNRLEAGSLMIGGRLRSNYFLENRSNQAPSNQLTAVASSGDVTVRSGAQLRAADVFLFGNHITLEQGASIMTLGRVGRMPSAAEGFIIDPNNVNMLAVSNSVLDVLPPWRLTAAKAPGAIRVGVCLSVCEGLSRLYSEGTITAATSQPFELGDALRYGTRNLILSVGAINIGERAELGTLAAQGRLPDGLALDQAMMSTLLRGDREFNAPALERLVLKARESVNFYGDVTLSTLDPATGRSSLSQLVLGTPAIYGWGREGQTARLQTDSLVWEGARDEPGATVSQSAGQGAGRLLLDVQRLTLGYASNSQVDSVHDMNRVTLGFGRVDIEAADHVTSTNLGSLSVYQARDAQGAGQGGQLTIRTSLLTGEHGSILRLSAGGDVLIEGGRAGYAPSLQADRSLGADVSVQAGGRLLFNTLAMLPSGKLSLSAGQDVQLGAQAHADLAGRRIDLFDAAHYSWGGDLALSSRQGQVRVEAGAQIDLSAQNNQAGRLSVTALDDQRGRFVLDGGVLASATGDYDAGGTWVPFSQGGAEIRVAHMDDFAALNQRLSEGAVTGMRRFQIRHGDLTVGDELRASEISLSLDNGALQVAGRIDASGASVGSIRLSAGHGVTLRSGAVLDAHGRTLRVDSYGQVIAAPNRAHIEINAGQGELNIQPGALLDLRAGTDGQALSLGTLALYAPRLHHAVSGDLAIQAGSGIATPGARRIDLYAVQRYADAPLIQGDTVDGRDYQSITQDYLDDKHDDSVDFMNAARRNASLLERVAGLRADPTRFHLRPAVELRSATADGDLHVDGDLDLSRYRYDGLIPAHQRSGVYGSGEAGALILRAGGNLEFFGSVNDGFDVSRLTAVDDDKGWVLPKGVAPWGGELIIPHSGMVTLGAGTRFMAGHVLNYDLPVQAQVLAAQTRLPAQARLNADLQLPAGMALGGDIRAADGSLLYAAGSVLGQTVTLPASTLLGAGLTLPVDASIGAMIWPKGSVLPDVVLARDLPLAKGARVPSETDVVLPNSADIVDLRPRDAQGNMGRTLSLAPMLAAGLDSWDLRLVAGADLRAADTRLTVPGGDAVARLQMHDTHYGLKYELAPVPGTGRPATYRWNPDMTADEMVMMEMFGMMPRPGQELNEEDMYSFEAFGGLDFNDWGFGVAWLPLDPGQEPEYAMQGRPATQQLFSVLRTGTGDLDLISAGNIGMSSPYGVYTAGTPSAALDSGLRYGFDLARGKNGVGKVLGASNADLERLVDRTHADNLYHAWYPESGGNVLLRAGGSLHGDIVGVKQNSLRNGPFGFYRADAGGSGNVGHWLWRQGSGDIASGADRVPTAWWINFGTYVDKVEVQNLYAEERQLVGFTGFGTLGGGNLVVEASADAGMLVQRGDRSNFFAPHSSGLNLTVASTGRVLGDGTLVQTGGGDLHVRIGGRLNAEHELRAFRRPGQTDMPSAAIRLEHNAPELNGTFTNLRGATHLVAGAVGGLELRYDQRDPTDSRGPSPYSSSSAIAGGGLTLVLGDSTARLDARGDLVLNGAGDPGRVSQYGYGSAFTARGRDRAGNGYSWFSLWTPASAIQLFSAGGHVAPATAWSQDREGLNHSASDGRYVYPSLFRAVSASGSLFYGNAVLGRSASGVADQSPTGVVLAPRPVGSQFVSQGASGQLDLMARQSIFGSDYLFSMSGADPTLLPSPWRPGFVGVTDSFWAGWQRVTNVSQAALAPSILINNSNSPELSARTLYPMFSMTPPTASGYQYDVQSPARYYAAQGDLVGIRVGSVVSRNTNLRDTGSLPAWYESGGAVQMRAGRDIVNAGTTLGGSRPSDAHVLGWETVLSRADASLPGRPMRYVTGVEYGNLIVHRNPDDISLVQAGGDIRYSSFYVAGPGELVLMAGGDVFMADKGELRSIGNILQATQGQRGGGAGITVLAGVGAQGPDYAAFAQRYLMADPARLPAGSTSYVQELTLPQWLTREFGFQGKPEEAPAFLREQQAKLDESGSAKRNLSSEFEQQSQLHLVNWLQTRFGGANGLGLSFDAQRDDARAFFQALPPEQRQSYLHSVYFAELKASGREYNGAGLRAGSYARGREAIATLFPQGVERSGGLTMFSSALYYDGTEFVLTRPKAGVNYVRYDEWLARGRPYGVNYYKALDSGIHTDFGGPVRVLTPGGQTLVGVDGGFMPDAGSGILTQGSGDIQIYSRDSILLGQSRIFTTFGGHILAWSGHGDINAGRGSKSTVVYTPQLRVYDPLGNVTLSPSTPSTGAGIATLNPIPEVPAGDIDLVAPEGTIDAGEAGIRVSGNVNLAAMHVANAANIKVQGESKGIPVVAAVNTAALTSASSAAGSATAAADAAVQRSRQQSRQNQPSVIQVQSLGFGQEQAAAQPGSAQPYLPQAALQVVGAGELSAGQRQQLTPQERSRLL